MVGVPLGLVTVYGSNFTPDAAVYIDEIASTFNSFISSNEVQTQVSLSFDEVAGTHTFSVHQASGISNSATFLVYNPVQGPQPFNAISSYFPEGADSPVPLSNNPNLSRRLVRSYMLAERPPAKWDLRGVQRVETHSWSSGIAASKDQSQQPR